MQSSVMTSLYEMRSVILLKQEWFIAIDRWRVWSYSFTADPLCKDEWPNDSFIAKRGYYRIMPVVLI